jgi:hypothetical protein
VPIRVYILTMLMLDDHEAIVARNVGVTCSLHDAERHKSRGIEFDFECLELEPNWQESSATTDVVIALRQFTELVRELQVAALR